MATLFQTNPVDAAYAHALAQGKRVVGKSSEVVDIALLLLDQVRANEFFDYQVYFVSELSKALETSDVDVLILNRASLLQRAKVVRSWGLLYQRDQKRRVVFEARAQSAAGLLFDLAYTSPNGAFLARVAAPASVAVSPIPAPPLLNPTMAVVAVAGSSAALLGVALTERGKSGLLFLLFVPLYTRLRHDKVLDHETRGMIRGYIVANPGDHYNSIKEALELPNGTLAYHIQVLQKEMIVRSVKDGKFRRFYPAEMRVPEGGEPTKIQRVILDLIRTNPGITARDAAGLLGLTSSTVSYHLEKLEELSRVEYRREGITKRLYVRGHVEPP